ncbi:hypothetical protein BT63DRAFT_421125 [Microthyrium microscopicum]|uniref:Uncharacterized protein n=1 Tax=Microthyrium microscopicum TaxID=703497 RepID=A0A6A6UN97_9PEZI|nr:hypothetical protein BT63DRAFT_421125 [Microthyrium microscopicum]
MAVSPHTAPSMQSNRPIPPIPLGDTTHSSFRLLHRVSLDYAEAQRLFNHPHVCTTLKIDTGKATYIAGTLASTQAALTAIVAQIPARASLYLASDSPIGRPTEHTELLSCHHTLLHAMAQMQGWINDRATGVRSVNIGNGAAEGLDELLRSPYARKRARERDKEQKEERGNQAPPLPEKLPLEMDYAHGNFATQRTTSPIREETMQTGMRDCGVVDRGLGGIEQGRTSPVHEETIQEMDGEAMDPKPVITEETMWGAIDGQLNRPLKEQIMRRSTSTSSWSNQFTQLDAEPALSPQSTRSSLYYGANRYPAPLAPASPPRLSRTSSGAQNSPDQTQIECNVTRYSSIQPTSTQPTSDINFGTPPPTYPGLSSYTQQEVQRSPPRLPEVQSSSYSPPLATNTSLNNEPWSFQSAARSTSSLATLGTMQTGMVSSLSLQSPGVDYHQPNRYGAVELNAVQRPSTSLGYAVASPPPRTRGLSYSSLSGTALPDNERWPIPVEGSGQWVNNGNANDARAVDRNNYPEVYLSSSTNMHRPVTAEGHISGKKLAGEARVVPNRFASVARRARRNLPE